MPLVKKHHPRTRNVVLLDLLRNTVLAQACNTHDLGADVQAGVDVKKDREQQRGPTSVACRIQLQLKFDLAVSAYIQ